MDGQERNDLLARAATALDLAQRSTHPDVVRAQYHIAAMSLDRIYCQPEEMMDVCPGPASAGSC